MNKIYEAPKAEINNFITEDVITTSGTNSLTAAGAKTFSASDANTTWSAGLKN